MRQLSVLAAVLFLSSHFGSAQEKPDPPTIDDQVLEKLKRAEEAYLAVVEEARQTLVAELGKYEKRVLETPDLTAEEKLRAIELLREERKALTVSGKYPTSAGMKSAVNECRQRVEAAKRECEKVFDDVATSYLATDLEAAKVVLARKADFFKPVVAKTQPEAQPDAAAKEFVGRWKIVNEKGVVTQYVTLTDRYTAKKDHAPDVKATWEVVNGAAHVTFEDGFLNVLRLEKGRMYLIGYPPGTKWEDLPEAPHVPRRAFKQ